MSRQESDELVAAHRDPLGDLRVWARAALRRDTAEMIGFIGLCHPLWWPAMLERVEVGWRLRREAWGFGYATEGGRAALSAGFTRSRSRRSSRSCTLRTHVRSRSHAASGWSRRPSSRTRCATTRSRSCAPHVRPSHLRLRRRARRQRADRGADRRDRARAPRLAADRGGDHRPVHGAHRGVHDAARSSARSAARFPPTGRASSRRSTARRWRPSSSAVDGVVEALDAISMPTCVASSSTHERLRFTLGLTGLYDRFEGRIFSATDVSNGKPAPDLFLHAAATLGADPARCAVIEDSRYGVEAARAAGMRAFGYAGGLTAARAPRRPGDHGVPRHARAAGTARGGVSPAGASAPAGGDDGSRAPLAGVGRVVARSAGESGAEVQGARTARRRPESVGASWRSKRRPDRRARPPRPGAGGRVSGPRCRAMGYRRYADLGPRRGRSRPAPAGVTT